MYQVGETVEVLDSDGKCFSGNIIKVCNGPDLNANTETVYLLQNKKSFVYIPERRMSSRSSNVNKKAKTDYDKLSDSLPSITSKKATPSATEWHNTNQLQRFNIKFKACREKKDSTNFSKGSSVSSMMQQKKS